MTHDEFVRLLDRLEATAARAEAREFLRTLTDEELELLDQMASEGFLN